MVLRSFSILPIRCHIGSSFTDQHLRNLLSATRGELAACDESFCAGFVAWDGRRGGGLLRQSETPSTEQASYGLIDIQILFLLDRLSGAISPSFFLQNIFLILITSPVSRLAALNYLARRMTKPLDHPDAAIETGLLIRGLGAALDDENVLVRRNALDLLLRVLKLESKVLK